MKLSLVTITFQNLSGLQKTIDSLRNQQNFDFEQWIVDGDSGDGTREYLEKLHVPWKLHWVSEKDQGRYDAMNKGTARAQGEFVWYLNAGDLAADPRAIADFAEQIERNPQADLIYGNILFITPYGHETSGRKLSGFDDFRISMPVAHPGILFRRTRLGDHPYRTDLQMISDWILVREWLARGGSFVYFDRVFAHFDVSGVSSQHQGQDLQEKILSEKNWLRKIELVLFLGSKIGLLKLFRTLGLYPFYKRWKVGRRLSR